jgi:hypothetical protein
MYVFDLGGGTIPVLFIENTIKVFFRIQAEGRGQKN